MPEDEDEDVDLPVEDEEEEEMPEAPEEKGSYKGDDGDDEEDEMDYEDMDDDDVEKALAKTVDILSQQQETISNLSKEIKELKKETAPPTGEVGSEEDDESVTEDFNPEEGQDGHPVDEHPGEDTVTDTGTDWSEGDRSLKGKQPTEDDPERLAKSIDKLVEDRVSKRLEDAVDETVEKAVDARVPRPMGRPNTELAQKARNDPFELVRKALERDRKNCGGDYNTGKGQFGFKSGTGDDQARMATEQFLRKAFGPHTPQE